jgi:D-alanyl-D-alanine carboxypeptidase/D-alanyl-D-alanine-endopeptidase (penicillin-binding protein 4)
MVNYINAKRHKKQTSEYLFLLMGTDSFLEEQEGPLKTKSYSVRHFPARARGFRSTIGVTLILLLLLLVSRLSWGDGSTLDARLRPFVQKGGIVVAKGDRLLFSHHGHEPFCPASTLKLATALTALYELGESYRFKTEFYLNRENDLIIRGYGDPFLISEEWEVIVKGLLETGKLPRLLRGLLLDPSSFSSNLRIPGIGNSLNPYDARNGALAANFNTAYVNVGGKGEILPAEPQTPLTPLVRRLARGLPAGRHRINMSRDTTTALTYVGELSKAFLSKGGFSFTGRTGVGLAGPNDRLIYSHRNRRSISEVIASMMLYSSNFIANQLLLAAGLEKRGEPATLENGLACLKDFLSNELGIASSDFLVVEGSGISRQNRITPRSLLTLLRAFYPHRQLLPIEKTTGARAKTGTLRGVYSLGGIVEGKHPLFFAIILNQKKNYRGKVLSLLDAEFIAGNIK